MARRLATKKKSGVTVDLSNVGKAFEADQEYLVQCVECTLEDGENGPYFAMKLAGTGDFEGAIMYNNASTSEKALYRLRPIVEAFGIEVPDGPMDLSPEDFIGKFAMCSTYKDRYNGKVSIKPEDFWPHEGDIPSGDTVDLDDISDDDIKKVGKAMGIKSKLAKVIRAELEEADPDELAAVLDDLGLAGGEAEEDTEEDTEEEAAGFDLDKASDDDIKALAEVCGIEGKITRKLRVALAKLSAEELAEAVEEAGLGSGSSDVTADAINAMNQEELEELISEHELDVDLDDHKTLRKKRTAVIDAAEEAGILTED